MHDQIIAILSNLADALERFIRRDPQSGDDGFVPIFPGHPIHDLVDELQTYCPGRHLPDTIKPAWRQLVKASRTRDDFIAENAAEQMIEWVTEQVDQQYIEKYEGDRNEPENPEVWITTAHAERITGINRGTLYRNAGPPGSGKPIQDNNRTGPKRRIRQTDVLAYADRRRHIQQITANAEKKCRLPTPEELRNNPALLNRLTTLARRMGITPNLP